MSESKGNMGAETEGPKRGTRRRREQGRGPEEWNKEEGPRKATRKRAQAKEGTEKRAAPAHFSTPKLRGMQFAIVNGRSPYKWLVGHLAWSWAGNYFQACIYIAWNVARSGLA
eukprot:12528593-Heterocapsa_arctica.AAC.1